MTRDPITFSVRTKPITYGDGVTFHEFQILMWLRRRVVGSEDGPRRTNVNSVDSRHAGRARIDELRAQRLFAIHVTRKDISNGEAHSCDSCAIAQALWRNQERMGFPKWSHDFRVAPYAGMFSTPYGISLYQRLSRDEVATGIGALPDVVFPLKRGGIATESMMEWAMMWDEWAARRHMTIKEWRENYGREAPETPGKPWPVSFVLNLNEMKAEYAER